MEVRALVPLTPKPLHPTAWKSNDSRGREHQREWEASPRADKLQGKEKVKHHSKKERQKSVEVSKNN